MIPDSDKVIKGLMCCTNGINNVPKCGDCPYSDGHGTCAKLDEFHRDALLLLRDSAVKANSWIPCSECAYWDHESGLSARKCEKLGIFTTQREWCSRAKRGYGDA